jgi:hypothetical protein
MEVLARGLAVPSVLTSNAPSTSSPRDISTNPPVMNDQLSAAGSFDDGSSGSPKRKKVRAKYAPKAW